jgi:hypothetical protein
MAAVLVLWIKMKRMKSNVSTRLSVRFYRQDLVREECTEYLELSESDLQTRETPPVLGDCDDLEVSKARRRQMAHHHASCCGIFRLVVCPAL